MRFASDYRPELDGLRALAVLSVVFFHAGFDWMPGGYIGVDVFFVISGYLITRLILTQVRAGAFSYHEFYRRRIRRLAPAFLATIVLTFGAAVLIFSLTDLTSLGTETVAVMVGAANIYYWFASGYFDAAAIYRPLLHTWSLAVEEQFYLFWPVTLLALLRWSPRKVIWAVALLGLASLAAAEWAVGQHRLAAFYLTPFRVWEFMLGAALLWLPQQNERRRWLGDLLIAVGLTLIAYAALTFTEDSRFPGLSAIVPCAGAAMIIWVRHSHVLIRILDNPASVGVGLISYSLYLVHWPVVVFYTYINFNHPLRDIDLWFIVGLSVAVAAALYLAVERPLRYRRQAPSRFPIPVFGLACAAVSLGIIYAAADARATLGWRWRVTHASAAGPAGYGPCRDVAQCEIGSADKDAPRLLVVGDSHARHLAFGLDEFGRSNRIGITLFSSPRCMITDYRMPVDSPYEGQCTELKKMIGAALDDTHGPILIAERWRSYPDFPVVQESWRPFLKAHDDRPMVLVGQMPQPFRSLARCGQIPRFFVSEAFCNRYERDDLAADYHRRWQAFLAEFQNVRYIPPMPLFCDDTSCLAQIDGKNLYADDHHLTERASAFFVAKVLGPALLEVMRQVPGSVAAGLSAASP